MKYGKKLNIITDNWCLFAVTWTGKNDGDLEEDSSNEEEDIEPKFN